jgi:hypothetical protein
MGLCRNVALHAAHFCLQAFLRLFLLRRRRHAYPEIPLIDEASTLAIDGYPGRAGSRQGSFC